MTPLIWGGIAATSFALFIVAYALHEVMTVPQRIEDSIFMPKDFSPAHPIDPGNPRMDKAYGFFGTEQWTRKYKHGLLGYDVPHSGFWGWYYTRFNIPYRERFWFSATFFVFITDAMHFSQWMMFNLIMICMGCLVWITDECFTWNHAFELIGLRILLGFLFDIWFRGVLMRHR